MNLQESDVLKTLLNEPFINQRILSEASGHSLGVVNRSLKQLIDDGYLDEQAHLTAKAQQEIKDKALNNKCPFEMEIFDDNSEVIFTSCHHSIHYDCLKAFIDRNNNLKEFKCFLCNNSLYKCQDDKINIAKN